MNVYVVKTGCFGFWSGSFRWRKVAVFVVKTYRFCLKNGTFWFPIWVLLSSCTYYVPIMYLLCMYYVCLIYHKTLVYMDLGCLVCIFEWKSDSLFIFLLRYLEYLKIVVRINSAYIVTQFGKYCWLKKPVSSKKTGSLKSCSLCFMIYRSKSTPTPNTRLVRVKSSTHLAEMVWPAALKSWLYSLLTRMLPRWSLL